MHNPPCEFEGEVCLITIHLLHLVVIVEGSQVVVVLMFVVQDVWV